MNGFGSMLKDYLDYYKVSKKEFADRLGITQKHMNAIINGKANLSFDLIIAISLLTDIDPKVICFVENKKKTYDLLIKKYKTEKEINKLLNKYNIYELEKRGLIKLKDRYSFTQNYLDLLEYYKVDELDIN